MPDDDALLQSVADLEATAFRRLQARLALLRAYARHRDEHQLSDSRAQEVTAKQYDRREVDVPSWVYDVYDSLSARTLRRWEKQLEKDGLAGLIDSHGRRSRRAYTSYFDPGTEMRRVVLHYLADHPDCTASDVMDELQRHFDETELPDLRTTQRFLSRMSA